MGGHEDAEQVLADTCRSGQLLVEKLRALADSAECHVKKGEYSVVWAIRYAAAILLFFEQDRWWQPVPKYDDCVLYLRRVFGEDQYGAFGPGLEAIVRLLHANGRFVPEPDGPRDRCWKLNGVVEHARMARHAHLMRALLNLPDDRQHKEDARDFLILLSSEGGWQQQLATEAEVKAGEVSGVGAGGQHPIKQPFGKAAPEPEALAAVRLSHMLACAYPNRKVLVRMAEPKQPDLRWADGSRTLALGDFGKEYRECHVFALGSDKSNCFVSLAMQELRKRSQSSSFAPWVAYRSEAEGKGGGGELGIAYPDGRFQPSPVPTQSKKSRPDLAVQHLRIESLLEPDVSTNLIAGVYAGGTAGGCDSLADPSYVLQWIRDQQHGHADACHRHCYSVLKVSSLAVGTWPVNVRLIERG